MKREIATLATALLVAMAFANDLVFMHGPDPYGLTVDEIGAIYLYTTQCLYGPLNKVLRASDRSGIRPYFLYLRLLLNALSKLPSYKGVVFRGIRLDLSGAYLNGR